LFAAGYEVERTSLIVCRSARMPTFMSGVSTEAFGHPSAVAESPQLGDRTIQAAAIVPVSRRRVPVLADMPQRIVGVVGADDVPFALDPLRGKEVSR
jgi:hypothetical protein